LTRSLTVFQGNTVSRLILISEFQSQTIPLEFVAPTGSETSFQILIFDGDTGGRWDLGTSPIEFKLYADPKTDGTGSFLIDTYNGSIMPDNDWFSIDVSKIPQALADNGYYFFRLSVKMPEGTEGDNSNVISNFKVATTGNVYLRPEKFAFLAAAYAYDDWLNIYPEFPALEPTPYDGTFTFFFDVPESQQGVEEVFVWDGDLDRGKYDGTDSDTDDLDTPNSVPGWAVEGTKAEGVATGSGISTGAPPDDADPGNWGLVPRSPAVRYELTTPAGHVFKNENPSGNTEWERFRISTNPSDIIEDPQANPPILPTADYFAPELQSGIYRVDLIGMDMQNLNAWYSPYIAVGVDEDGNPNPPPKRIYRIGDYVWLDAVEDCVKTTDERGIQGVVVELLDGITGNPMLDGSGNAITTTTDPTGWYEFTLQTEGEYTVRVADENFNDSTGGNAPGKLLDYTPTCDLDGDGSNDNVYTHKVDDVTPAVLTYDFGYNIDYSQCGECEGKVEELTLQYLGEEAAEVKVTQKDGKDKEVLVYGPLLREKDDVFTFYGHDKKDTLGPEISIYVSGVLKTKIHTSCSEDIGPGLPPFGDFLVVEGYSRNGGLLCPY